ncbi:uncharacterized protein SAPINGB_P003899 [Magnusiomyces paraingens]|uniref:U3 small nucleolar RNA-associated protein 15 C-terminal domain-containing protein n=1 Tax=Magnusiomyces paraingens TaxID=2606893 RepID=A0A5E8BZ56_9ASCO|nr:uncharacterized protein SAPINGB_P003899 [Saprochaete ingens]VVT54085.1 unnamed protein product [Saprochaete ingens]
MSAPLRRLEPAKNPGLPSKITPEQTYWRGFRSPLLVKENNAVNHIHFNPQSPHDFAVTSSTRVQIFSAKTRQVVRTIARFKDTVYSGEFRSDGKLLVAGDATGLVQVFDASSRSILVTLQPTLHPTHVTKFHPSSLTTLLTASDDKVARLYDITASKPVATFDQHGDYIRTACFVPDSTLIATGCYDGIFRIFDSRAPAEGPVFQYNQNSQVESVLALNSTTVVLAGGPFVKVWDITAGKMIKNFSNFQKAVTTLSDAGPGKGLIAGSLDGHVKVFDYSTPNWEVTFGWKFGGPVLSSAVSPDHKHFVTGLASGLLSIRTRKTEGKEIRGPKGPKTSNIKRLLRGLEYHGELEHRIIDDTVPHDHISRKKTPLWERHLRAFRWADSLDAAIESKAPIEVKLLVLEELRKRGKVQRSLAGRDEASLEPLLRWSFKAIKDFRALPVVADFLSVILDMYGPLIEISPLLEQRILELRSLLISEVNVVEEAQKLQGMMELLIG